MRKTKNVLFPCPLFLVKEIHYQLIQKTEKFFSLYNIEKLILHIFLKSFLKNRFFSGTGTENECFNLTYTNNGGRESTFADVCFCNEDK